MNYFIDCEVVSVFQWSSATAVLGSVSMWGRVLRALTFHALAFSCILFQIKDDIDSSTLRKVLSCSKNNFERDMVRARTHACTHAHTQCF